MGAIKSPLKTNNMNLESPHNDEQCVCSNPEQLENASLKDCAFMFKQFADDLNNINKYMTAAIKEAIEMTLKYRDARTCAEVEKILNRYLSHYNAGVQELCSEIDSTIVSCDQEKCPYCK
jgi:hypothetical protein